MLAVGLLQQTPVVFTDTAVIGAFKRIDPAVESFRTAFKQPIDDAHYLLIVSAASPPHTVRVRPGAVAWGNHQLLGVFLMARADASRAWELLILTDHAGRHDGTWLRVDRFDASSLVLSQQDNDYGFRSDSIKLFFDVRSKRLIRRVDYPPIGGTHVVRADDQLCATMDSGRASMQTGETPARRVCMESGRLVDRGGIVLTPAAGAEAPADLAPLPQSSYDEFAVARPERVKNGYSRNVTRIEEKAGAWQRIGSRIWFGKTFYDGEGHTGVGDLGYFDTTSRTFAFLKLPELASWSVSALLVEGNDAWVGLMGQPEGAAYSNGLLRVDLKGRQTRRYEIPDVIRQLVRWNGALYVATDHGLYVVRDERVTRFRLEPGLNGAFVIAGPAAVNR